MNIITNRDLSLVELTENKILVISCDSLGGIGLKEKDQVEAPPKLVGRFTLRVALMELMAVRANLISVVNNLSVEYKPTGKEIISGIKEELARINLDADKLLTGSTEENIATVQTGLGITTIGVIDKNKLSLANSNAGDVIVAVGLPKVGREVLASKDKTADLEVMKKVTRLAYLSDILPVGSQGIEFEAELLAALNSLKFKSQSAGINYQKSAGPATVILTTLKPDKVKKLN